MEGGNSQANNRRRRAAHPDAFRTDIWFAAHHACRKHTCARIESYNRAKNLMWAMSLRHYIHSAPGRWTRKPLGHESSKKRESTTLPKRRSDRAATSHATPEAAPHTLTIDPATRRRHSLRSNTQLRWCFSVLSTFLGGIICVPTVQCFPSQYCQYSCSTTIARFSESHWFNSTRENA